MFVKQVMVLSFSAVGFVWIYLAIFGRFIQGPQSSLSGPVDAFMKPQLSKAFDRSLHFGTCTLMVKGDTERKRERERARARERVRASFFVAVDQSSHFFVHFGMPFFGLHQSSRI